LLDHRLLADDDASDLLPDGIVCSAEPFESGYIVRRVRSKQRTYFW